MAPSAPLSMSRPLIHALWKAVSRPNYLHLVLPLVNASCGCFQSSLGAKFGLSSSRLTSSLFEKLMVAKHCVARSLSLYAMNCWMAGCRIDSLANWLLSSWPVWHSRATILLPVQCAQQHKVRAPLLPHLLRSHALQMPYEHCGFGWEGLTHVVPIICSWLFNS